jgi:hypothetical protein
VAEGHQFLNAVVTMPWYGWLAIVLGGLAYAVVALWYTKRPLRPSLRRLLERVVR